MQKISVALLAVLLGWNPVLAGVVFEIETREHPGQSAPTTETSYIASDGRSLVMSFRSRKNGGREDLVIFLGDRREMVVVDHARKSYMVMNVQTTQKMAAQMKQAMDQARAQMEQAMQGIPEARRAMAEKRLKEQMPAWQAKQLSRSIIHKVGDQAEMDGYPCVLFEVVRDGRKVRDLWVTDWSNVEGGRELELIFNDMSAFFRILTESMPPSKDDSSALNDNVFALIQELGGFPIASRDYAADGTIESESALRKSKRQKIDPASFKPPAGYEQQAMF